MRLFSVLFAVCVAALVFGCSEEESGDAPSAGGATGAGGEAGSADGPTWYADARPIVEAKCATCHRVGDIGPFPMTTLEEVMAFAAPVRASIDLGTMPPWQPSDECNTYLEHNDLTPEEKATLLAWIDAGGPAGDPADAPEVSTQADAQLFEADMVIPLPEPYAPTIEPDDYRCQLIPWPAEETRYVTGLRVKPDKRAIVHHVIVFVAGPEQAERYRAFDEAEPGPGYTCYGGPTASGADSGLGSVDRAELLAALGRAGITLAELQSGDLSPEQVAALLAEVGADGAGSFTSIGSWVPGAIEAPFPAGTGIRVEPGSLIVAQFHYNTLSAEPVADQSVIEIATATEVEREATMLPILDLGWVSNGLLGDPMTIPAGEAEVKHETTLEYDSFLLTSARRTLGLADDAPPVAHMTGHHMHELGTRQRTDIIHSDGTQSCVLENPEWDFGWQGRYTLEESITIRPGDSIRMGCTWDNSASNQPIIDGEVREPIDVRWGEGTTDEMCLGSLYVTRE